DPRSELPPHMAARDEPRHGLGNGVARRPCDVSRALRLGAAVPVVAADHRRLRACGQRRPSREPRSKLLAGGGNVQRRMTRGDRRPFDTTKVGDDAMYLFPLEVLAAENVTLARMANVGE